jgi:site-specific DNA-cytosine methylase
MIKDVEIRHAHFFCGLGGGAKGFNNGEARVGNLRAKYRCLGGIDCDPASIRDFESLAGVPGTLLDLFDRDQYRAVHGREPPTDWREATIGDIHRAFQNERPHIVFLSAPCKGFSGLLSEKASGNEKYQALNRLTLRGIWLMLEAYHDDPVELIVFENVPRIATRGRPLLDQIVALLRQFGYAVAETTHDCGEIGGLGQSRKRFLLVARHIKKVPPFLYEPLKHKLKGVGEILEKLPMPLLGLGGAMHRMPSLQWKTWVRLAFVEAGSDWRSLNKLNIEDGQLKDFGIAPDVEFYNGALGVQRWVDPSGTVTSNGRPASGSFSVADPRVPGTPYNHVYRIVKWNAPSPSVTSANGGTAAAVADPRIDGHAKSVQMGVRKWEEPAGVVTGKMFVGGGPNSVADPRFDGRARSTTFGVKGWEQPSNVVAGESYPTNGPFAVADPRPAQRTDYKQTKYRVTGMDEPAGAVIAASTTGNGAFAVADPRTGYDDARKNVMRVTPWEEPGGTVTAGHSPSNGALAVADPRTNWGEGAHENKLAVRTWEKPSKTVTGSDRVGSGAQSVADPRPAFLGSETREKFQTAGLYGVIGWKKPSGAIAAHGQLDNGRWSVADPRALTSEASNEAEKIIALPQASERLICVIRALDGTWHRPFTTLELASLQGLADPEETLELDGLSDSAWRERIGNAVPPPAAAAIASVMGRTLLAAWSGETFMLSSEPIWVQPIAVALMAARNNELNIGDEP